jgi:hypothetical protein
MRVGAVVSATYAELISVHPREHLDDAGASHARKIIVGQHGQGDASLALACRVVRDRVGDDLHASFRFGSWGIGRWTHYTDASSVLGSVLHAH